MSRGTETCEMCGAEHDKGTWGYVAVMVGLPVFLMTSASILAVMGTDPTWVAFAVFAYGFGILSSLGIDPHI